MLVTHRPSVVLTRQRVDVFLRRLRPGDLLFAMQDGAKGGGAIQAYQLRYGYRPRAADASHVAIYCGDHMVVHAVRPTVRVESIFPYFLNREVSVGLWDAGGVSPQTRDLLGKMICKAAFAFQGQAYETAKLFRQVVDGRYGLEPLVCSTLVDLAYDAVLGESSPIHSGPGSTAPFITPAHIFSRAAFR